MDRPQEKLTARFGQCHSKYTPRKLFLPISWQGVQKNFSHTTIASKLVNYFFCVHEFKNAKIECTKVKDDLMAISQWSIMRDGTIPQMAGSSKSSLSYSSSHLWLVYMMMNGGMKSQVTQRATQTYMWHKTTTHFHPSTTPQQGHKHPYSSLDNSRGILIAKSCSIIEVI